MKLIKEIDFTKLDAIDEEIFNICVGEKWANEELQQYVNDKEHLYFDNGLVFNATLENGIYKSARINTKGKLFFKYGRIEVTAKVPKGKGTWPAIWMMSEHQNYGHWPRSGEIDIMEHVGRDLDKLFLCIHTEKYNHRYSDQYYRELVVPGLSDTFQTFGLDWTEDSITYLLNGEPIASYKKGENNYDSSHKGWPFDDEFYLILNLAIGGKFGGDVDETCFPQQFKVKNIKIYQ